MSKFFLVLLGTVGVLAATYVYYFPAYEACFRMTVNVEVDGKVHSGSSVIQVGWQTPNPLFRGLAAGWNQRFEGEAVLVDLGKPGVLLALLKNPYFWSPDVPNARPLYEILLKAFFGSKGITKERLEDLEGKRFSNAKRTLQVENLPRFAYLSDVNNRQSAIPVDPRYLSEDIGPGVRFVSAQLELTSDPIIYHLENELPWFAALKKFEKENGIGIRGRPRGQPGAFQLLANDLIGGIL